MRLTDDQLAELHKRFSPFEPKPCRVCGAPLTMADSGGGGHGARYACSSDAASMMKASGREAYEAAIGHYQVSRTDEPYPPGNPLVVALIEELQGWRERVTTERTDDYMADFQRHWWPLISKGDQIDTDKLARELSDAYWLTRAISEVYQYVTGGRVSKPFAMPEAVCSLADEWAADAITEGIDDELKQLKIEIEQSYPATITQDAILLLIVNRIEANKAGSK